MHLPTGTYRTFTTIAAVVLLTVAMAACSGGDDDDDDTAATAIATASSSGTTATTTTTTQSSSGGTTAAYTSSADDSDDAAEDGAASYDSTTGSSQSYSAPTTQTNASDDAAGAATPSPASPATVVGQQRSPTTTRPPTPASPSAPQRSGPSATTFKNYGRTPFVDASSDAVSTFSLDTDRTSYFLALNWVRNGYAVEPDSVRAEEWVNAFAYHYDQPRDDLSFSIRSDVVAHPLGGGRHLARVALQAPELRDDTPVNVTLVLDASGSMAGGNRVDIARTAAETIRQSLSPRDRIAVVHFTTDVLGQYTVEHSSPGDRDVVRSIERLAPHGSTNVQAGLNRGVQLAEQARRERPEAFNYIILMSDGVANVDATNPFAILDSAPDRDHLNPLRLITVGVGIANYNDYLLEQLAQHGNGWYRYLDDTAQARSTFSRENWLALSRPFADQARAQVTWDPWFVQSWRIVGYENRVTPDHTFEQNRKEFAELPSGAATTVFYELVLRDEARSRSATLADIEVRWVHPVTGDTYAQTSTVRDGTGAPFDAGDRYLRLGAIVALAADRYSALTPQVANAAVDAGGIHSDLEALLAELGLLHERLGSAEAYRDFRQVLDSLTVAAAELAPSTGYSQ
ncbi:MAG: von Willebrand factor type A domain-containing protein [Chloroflexota bacterium]|nr:von Willebrand factor type A domain-containing protein [Chloroflexota bacterium]